MNEKLLSVIVPAYNEEKTISETLKKVAEVPVLKEIIVVNDGSRDNTKKIIEEAKKEIEASGPPAFVREIKFINKQKNEGKGAAIRAGLKEVMGDIILIQDADLELSPDEYPRLIEPFYKYGADVVFGSRFRMEGVKRVYNFWHFKLNKFLTAFSNILSGLYLTDMETCYKVSKREVIMSLNLKSNRFGIEPEFVAKIAKKDLNIFEVGISYHARSKKQGKKIRPKDGIYTIAAIIWYNLFD